MQTSAIVGVSLAKPVAQTAAAKPHKTSLDQADFLSLLSAQLKNQDPTKPVDNAEYVAQLAQFSTVSGIERSNATLDTIAGKLDRLIAVTPAATPRKES